MRYYLQLLFCLFLFSGSLSAQIRIRGTVSNSEGEPIEVVHVRLKSGLVGTLTDFKGNYELIVPSSDSLTVVYSCLGYRRVTRLLVSPAEKVELNVRMYSDSEMLQEVEVSASRLQTSTLQKLNMGEYNRMPDATGGSVESLLGTLAGVHVNNELSSGYSVRGGNFDENIVYVNGIEVYRPQLVRSGQQEGLSFINPDMVGSLEFSSGGYSAEYGDRMASVLDITYKKPEAFEGAVSASLLGASAFVGQTAGNFTQLHGFRFKKNSTLLSSLDSKGEYDPSFFDYQGYLTMKLSDRVSCNLLGNIARNKYEFIPRNRSTSFGTLQNAHQFTVYFGGREKDLFQTLFGALTLGYTGIRRTSLELLISAFSTRENETYDISGEYWLTDMGGDQDALATAAYREHARNRLHATVYASALKGNTRYRNHRFAYGVNVQREQIRDEVSEWNVRDSAGYIRPRSALSGDYDGATVRMSTFLSDTYRFQSEHLLYTLNAGVRASYWQFNREFLVSPRVSLGIVPAADPRFTFRIATGLYYQAPFYKEYRDTLRDDSGNLKIQMNDGIRSPRSLHVILGGDYTFNAGNRPFKLTTEFYYKKIDDLIPYVVDNVRIRYSGQNNGSGSVMGMDMKFFGEFVPGSDSWISFSLMRARETVNGITRPRPMEQRYGIALFFNDYVPRFPKYKMSVKAIWSDGLPMSVPGNEGGGTFRSPAYRRVDLGLSRLLTGTNDRIMARGGLRYLKSVWLGIDLFNLFDTRNTSSYYWVDGVNDQQYAVPNYLTGRQINLRLSVEF